jgi:putative transposase
MQCLKSPFKKIPNQTKLILHSDQGWQYQMKKYQQLLKNKGVIKACQEKETVLDNAIIENFFGILKSELFILRNTSQ